MNTPLRIIKNTAFLLISKIIVLGINFIPVIYLARILGPDNFGKINFATAIVVYFAVIANLGLPILGTRQIARESSTIREYVGNILMSRLCLAIFSFILLFFISFFINKPLEIKYLLFLYSVEMVVSVLFLDWVFQGIEKMEYIGLANIFSAFVYLILIYWFIKSTAQLLLIPCFSIIAKLLAVLLLLAIFTKSLGRPKFSINFNSFRYLLKQSLPIGLTIFMSPIILYTDTVMLGFMKNNEEVGYYNAASKIIVALLMLSVVYQDAVFPVISKYYKTSLDLLKKIQCYSIKLLITITLPLVIGGTIIAKPLIYFLYGTNYTPAVIVFKILIWFFAFEFSYSVFARGLLACNQEKERLIIITILTLSNILLNLILIPYLGIKGAAIASVLVRMLGFYLFQKEFNKIVRIPIHLYILRPLIASVIMGLFLYLLMKYLNLNLFLLIFTGFVTYLLFLYFTKGIKNEELVLIKNTIFSNKSNLTNSENPNL